MIKSKIPLHQPKKPYYLLIFFNKTFLIYTSITIYIFYFNHLFTSNIYAQSPPPPTYRFHFVNLNATFSSQPISATISSQPNLPSLSSHIKAILPFNLTVSNISINFNPETQSTQSQTITVSTGQAPGYSLSLLTNHLPKLKNSNSFIPNTKCDHFCDLQTAGQWTDPAKSGYGFSTNFFIKNYFKPFPIADNYDLPLTIKSLNLSTQNQTINLTYKLIFSPNQPPGNYQNQINLYASPAY